MPDPIKLPPGAKLVSDGSSSAMPLPAGATLVTPPQQAQQPEQPGFFKRLGQSFGLPTSQAEFQQMQANEDALPLWQRALPHAPGSAPSPGMSLATAALGPIAPVATAYAQTAGKGIKEGFQEAKEAGQNISQGGPIGANLGKAASGGLHGVLQSIPVIGPSIDTAGQDIDQGNYAGAAGGLTGVISQLAAPKIANKIPPDSILGRALLLGKTPEGAYESAMKPSTTIPAAKRAGLAQTAIQEGIPVSQKGLGKLGDLIDNVNQEIAQKVASDPNRPISTSQAMQNVTDLKANGPFGNQVNPRADLGAIDASAQEFQDIYGNQMPASQAQAVKQGTYQALRSKYGELGSASTEAQKALARGLKEELANQFPELNDLNARDSRLIGLQVSLERAVNRIGNHQLLGIGTPIAGAAASAVTGSPGIGKVAMVMKAVLDNPVVKSKLAIALSQGKIPSPLVLPKIAAYSGALNRLSQPSTLPFLPGSQQPPAQSPDQ